MDWTAEALWRIIETEGDRCLTYHLTNPYPDTVGYLKGWVNDLVRESNIERIATTEQDRLTVQRIVGHGSPESR